MTPVCLQRGDNSPSMGRVRHVSVTFPANNGCLNTSAPEFFMAPGWPFRLTYERPGNSYGGVKGADGRASAMRAAMTHNFDFDRPVTFADPSGSDRLPEYGRFRTVRPPRTRMQFRSCTNSVCTNSLLRAYQWKSIRPVRPAVRLPHA